MNVYDFDKTIYDGDSTVDFYKYCLKKNIMLIRYLPYAVLGYIKYKFKIISKTRFKEHFYSFLKGIKDIDKEVSSFWDKNFCKVKKWYLDVKRDDDVIISASPEFLLNEVCRRLNVTLIASRVDKKTGKYTGENCKGEEKVIRFREIYGDTQIDKFYSDSLSDLPLARLAMESYIVKKNEIRKWEI